ncbi:MAG: flagellar motor switch protein FliN [Syntrophomonadaceae bacterium]|nr:flagellar motor switch protein FliN [Syntrophomonadaceae bacterium]
MDLILDIPLKVSVLLGKTRKSIGEVLNFGPGSIVELERMADEPVDVLVNGVLIARGEVVVVEEYFGVRITDIISPENRVINIGKNI